MDDLRAKREEILQAAYARGVFNIRVYGSVARGDAGPESDIDLIVDIESDRSLFDLIGFQLDLEEFLDHPVGVTTRVDALIRRRVEAQAVPL